jgi:hypothetical protein
LPVHVFTTVDPGGETPEWQGEIGFVPTVLERLAPSSENTIAIVCGPPIIIKFTFPVLTNLGFAPGDVFTTLENRMKCGIGKCGRCNVVKISPGTFLSFDIDFPIQYDRDICDYPPGIESLFEKKVQVMSFLKINIMDLFEFPVAEFFQ